MSRPTEARWQVRASRCIDYVLDTVDDVFDPRSDSLLAAGRHEGSRRFVVVDAQVYRFHAPRIENYFRQRAIEARILPMMAGEAGKTVEAWLGIVRELDQFPIHRRDEPIIAIGGGVLTDVVGFVASSYRRGVPHVKVPTTLMGYVDASVGIKTGINFNGHKNRLGSFEPARAVLLDRRLLATLPLRHQRNGLCEIIKLALACDAELFEMLEHDGARGLASAFQDEGAQPILDRAIDGMLKELSPNFYEDELARKVDFGHTFSYGLEMYFEERLLHGEAVLLDILFSCVLAHERGLLEGALIERVFALVRRLGIEPAYDLLDAELMWGSLLDRVEHRNGQQLVPLPCALGQCVFVNDITRAEVAASIRILQTWTTQADERITEC
ncbi:sedoheptulose 7-phosphate cyclase [Castellaniella sp.]|uniref:sedoheptulose 7-phosphate cyclase n=1 Tax=Castellaniella sp. TaxID=1955812 RepID=UPI00356AA7C0